jgi:hypothetical protein
MIFEHLGGMVGPLPGSGNYRQDRLGDWLVDLRANQHGALSANYESSRVLLRPPVLFSGLKQHASSDQSRSSLY